MDNKIDIVILWVDGQDNTWLKKKKTWQNRYGIIDNQIERYRSWDNLQYLFRGIEKFAPWVNKVFLVTDNQKPEWLDENYEKIKVIDHTEIIDEKYLPTFNSSAIELNIHKIENLSNHFIYFNDDIFIINKIYPEDFFINGTPKETVASNINIPSRGQYISRVIYNNLTIINDNFDKHCTIKKNLFNWLIFKSSKQLMQEILLLPWKNFTGFYTNHLCAPYKKETYIKVWEKYSDDLRNTTQNKFRNNQDNNQYLMRYWQFASNDFVPRKRELGRVFNLSNKKSVNECSDYIRNQKGKVVCVNDGENLADFSRAKKDINSAFISRFPNKSKFEK